MIFLTSPGKTYSVNSVSGCTISAGGTTLVTIPANVQTTFIAPEEEVLVSDNNAIIVEVTGVGAGGSGGTGEGGSGGVTAEEIQAVMPIAWSAYTIPAEVTKESSIALGGRAWAKSPCTTALGVNTGAYGGHSTSVGNSTVAQLEYTTAVGAYSYNGSSYIRTTSEAPQTVVVGNGAQILNPKNADGTPVLDSDGKQIVSSNSVTIGTGATCNNLDSVVIGANAKAGNVNSEGSPKTGVAIGANSEVMGGGANVAVGTGSRASGGDVSIGYMAKTGGGNSVAVGYNTLNNGAPKTVTIGSNATITNTTAADGTITYSEKSTVIGFGASASAPDAVVMGAGASVPAAGGVAIGVGSKTINANSIAIGSNSQGGHGWAVAVGGGAKAIHNSSTAIGGQSEAGSSGVSVGFGAKSTLDNNICIGVSSLAKAKGGIAIGYQAQVADACTVVLRSFSWGDQYSTNLYFAGANTPLAVTYEGGEAMMGYVVRDEQTKEIVAAGTQKLSALFPNNSTFQPATTDENGEWVQPKVFHPSDLDLPVEEPQEPEDVTINIPEPTIPEPHTPLPVYPIVEPEDITTNLPEPEPYTPLPVYPIVEPEIEEIPSES